MEAFDELKQVISRLRAKDGCPWDREQTHESLKASCIEEAAEVICGINIYAKTGRPENLREELGDLLLQVLMHAQIAEDEGIFTLEDVVNGIKEKMIRRHPHIFGDSVARDSAEVLVNWEKIKEEEKSKETAEDKEREKQYLFEAFDEAKGLIDAARKRKEAKWKGEKEHD